MRKLIFSLTLRSRTQTNFFVRIKFFLSQGIGQLRYLIHYLVKKEGYQCINSFIYKLIYYKQIDLKYQDNANIFFFIYIKKLILKNKYLKIDISLLYDKVVLLLF